MRSKLIIIKIYLLKERKKNPHDFNVTHFFFVQRGWIQWWKARSFSPLGKVQFSWGLYGAMGTPWGSGRTCGCTQRYHIKRYHDPCTHKWIKAHPHVLKILSPRGVGQSVRECGVKALCDVKVTGSKPAMEA